MTAAEARRGGKPGDLDPPMDILKANWLREVDEVLGDESELIDDEAENTSLSPQQILPPPPPQPSSQTQPQPQPALSKSEGKAPPTPTTPSTRSMAIDSIVDKMDAS